MNGRDAGNNSSRIVSARSVVASPGQGFYATGMPVIRRLSSQTSASGGSHPMALSTVVSGRYPPVNRINTHPTGSTYMYPVKRPLSNEYSCDLHLVRKFPRSTDKSKGLRHFSTKVCEKVKEKRHTNYNEVADELVAEYFDSADVPPGDTEKQQYDMKNIRRRVYDALNVLMAMNIIEKEKKEIRWVGLPTSSLQECRKLEEEKAKRQERIRHKADQLQELIIQLVAYKTLVEKNRELERESGRPREEAILYLPFIIVNTAKKTFIDCAISHDKTEYLFNFDQPFEIHDDIEVLKRLGLAYGLERGEVSDSNREKIKSYLPLSLRDYVDQIIDGNLNNAAYDIPSNNATNVPQQTSKQTLYTMNSPAIHSSSALAVRQSTVNIPQGYQQHKRQPPSATRITQPVLPRVASSVSISDIQAGSNSNLIATSPNGYRTVRATSGQQYQGDSNTHQGTYSTSRQINYSIQNAGQSHLSQGQQYEEVYEEEENMNYE